MICLAVIVACFPLSTAWFVSQDYGFIDDPTTTTTATTTTTDFTTTTTIYTTTTIVTTTTSGTTTVYSTVISTTTTLETECDATAEFSVTFQVGDEVDLILQQEQQEFEWGWNDLDRFTFSNFQYSFNLDGFEVQADVLYSDTIRIKLDIFSQAKKEALIQLIELNGGTKVYAGVKQSECRSCLDGKYGGCSHRCSNDVCDCPPCWYLSNDRKTCLPEADKFNLECNATNMTMTVDECVLSQFTHHVMPTLADEACISTYTNDEYSVTAGLGDCGTDIYLNTASQLITFQNKLVAKPDTSQGIIMSPNYELNFQCQYTTGYPDIHLVRRKNVVRIIIFGDEMAVDENGSTYLSLEQKRKKNGIRNFESVEFQSAILILEKNIENEMETVSLDLPGIDPFTPRV